MILWGISLEYSPLISRQATISLPLVTMAGQLNRHRTASKLCLQYELNVPSGKNLH